MSGAAARAGSTVLSRDGTTVAYQSLGAGGGVIVLGGALSTSHDYIPLARALAQSRTVHLVERRGRGSSGPQGSDYSVEREVEDLLAVQQATGAATVFGHSYGGLVALETARCSIAFSEVIVYEPGVSINGSIPSDWTAQYRELLARGDARGAYAALARGSGFAPPVIARLPGRCVKSILSVAVTPRRWRQIQPLLGAQLAEGVELARVDEGTAERFASIGARVLLLGGRKSPPFITTNLFHELRRAIPDTTVEIIDGLGHTAPSDTAPDILAQRVLRYLSTA